MEYQKFDDPVALLLDLCEPMNDREKKILGVLGYKLAKDAKFRQNYINSVKRFYMKHFHEMKSGNYVRQPFETLNQDLINGINDDTKDIYFVPSYAVFDPHEENKELSAKEKAKIMRELVQNKKR